MAAALQTVAEQLAADRGGRALFCTAAFALSLRQRRDTRPLAEGRAMLDGMALFTLYRAGAAERDLAPLSYPDFLRALGPHVERVCWVAGRTAYVLKPDESRLTAEGRAQLAVPAAARLHRAVDRAGLAIACTGLAAAAIPLAALAALLLA